MSNDLTVAAQSGVTLFRASTDAAGLCRDIVLHSAKNIQGRKFVQVEGWQAIAVAHGCAASSGEVKRTEEGGFLAIGRVVNMTTGIVVAEAEGYVGPDEPVWFGGIERGRTYPKRPDYAIRAMAQTRAISRACRSAFAHVVVMMNAGLQTTPAEEVPPGGFDDEPEPRPHTKPQAPRQPPQRPEPAAPEIVEEIPQPINVDALIHKCTMTATIEGMELWRDEIRRVPKGPDRERLMAAVKRRVEEIREELEREQAAREQAASTTADEGEV